MGKGDKNRESPTGKRAKKRTLRRMDNRNKASILNSRRKRNRRIIDAVVTDHFEMFVGDRIEISAGRTETTFAEKRNKFERTTRRTPIHSTAASRITAMNHFFNAFKNNRTGVKGVLDFFVMI